METKFDHTKITEARVTAGMSVSELARKIRKSRTVVYKWESGFTEPNARTLSMLSEALVVPVGYFFGQESNVPVRCEGSCAN